MSTRMAVDVQCIPINVHNAVAPGRAVQVHITDNGHCDDTDALDMVTTDYICCTLCCLVSGWHLLGVIKINSMDRL